jgi:hypothetical protein
MPRFVAQYYSTIITGLITSWRMRWGVLVARMGDMRNACRVLEGKHIGNIPLERSKRRWDGITKKDLRGIRQR